MSPFNETLVLNSFAGSLSASSTPSCNEDKSTDVEFPSSMSMVKLVPERVAPVRFWLSLLEIEDKSTLCVPPPSVI